MVGGVAGAERRWRRDGVKMQEAAEEGVVVDQAAPLTFSVRQLFTSEISLTFFYFLFLLLYVFSFFHACSLHSRPPPACLQTFHTDR